jgi:outer membrane protein
MKIVFPIIAVTLLCTVFTAAQQPVRLTLEKAVDLALEQNLNVIQARNNLEGSQSSVLSAYGNFLPTLDASGSAFQQQSWTPSTGGGTVIIGGYPINLPGSGGYARRESYSTSISSGLTLFNGFANYATLKRSQSGVNASEYTLGRTQQTIIDQAHQLFLNIFGTFQLLKVNEENLKRDQRQLERIEESNKVGAVALADVYRQRTQVATDELALINAESSHEKAKADLIAFLGIDFSTEYEFDFTGIPKDIDTTEFVALNAKYGNFNNLVQTAVEKRPDYQASIENLNASDASVTVARAGYYPSLRLSGSYGFNNDVLSRISDNKNLSLGLSISLPIFSGFSTRDQMQQAQVQFRNADEQVRQSNRQIRVDVRKALLDLEAAEKQVTVTQTAVVSAEMDRQIAEEKYNLGAGTLLDLLVASANYTNVLSNKVSAVISYLLAQKGVEYALGMIEK